MLTVYSIIVGFFSGYFSHFDVILEGEEDCVMKRNVCRQAVCSMSLSSSVFFNFQQCNFS